MKKAFIWLLVVLMVLSVPSAALAKTYKSSKVTAKQVVTELKKTTGLIKKVYKADVESNQYKLPNNYKSKYNFTDKKYKDVYCSVEVFRNYYDAVGRKAYLDAIQSLYSIFEWEEDIPLGCMRYKNVLIRFGSKMPLSRALKYYKALKKMIK